jgi:hypothetical protein
MRRLIVLTILLTLTVAAGACAAYRSCPYHIPSAVGSCPAKGGPVDDVPDSKYSFGFVEIDDQGWFWSRAQLEAVLAASTKVADEGNTVFVVYVHGWHHSADSHDDNVLAFRQALSELDDSLNKPAALGYRMQAIRSGQTVVSAAREDGRIRVFGLYVGWRGGSLPGDLDLATFAERKPAAHRVGYGDLGELLARLDDLYDRENLHRHYTGMVVIGHSFGAAALYSAIAGQLQRGLVARSVLAGLPPEEKARESGRSTGQALDKAPVPGLRIRSVGDLVVLVNPAFEASLYQSVSELSHQTHYHPSQQPVLLTVSSEEDWPNRRFFPLGESILVQNQGLLRDKVQKHQAHTSLGNVPEQVTHCLKLVGGQDCSLPGAPGGVNHEPSANEEGTAGPLGAARKFADTYLYPAQEGLDPQNPILLVRTTGQLIPGHDLFTKANDHSRDQFKAFLIQFVRELINRRFQQQSGLAP